MFLGQSVFVLSRSIQIDRRTSFASTKMSVPLLTLDLGAVDPIDTCWPLSSANYLGRLLGGHLNG